MVNVDERLISIGDSLALIDRDESHFWDHKSARSSGSVVQKVSSALANSDGGEFIVGIEDARSGSGLERWSGFQSIEDATPVLDALARDVKPPIPYSVDFLRVEGREELGIVVHVTVRKSESVHYCADGKVYVRRGASSAAIAGQAITDLNLSKGARSYEDQLLGEYDLEDLLDEAELHYFLGSYSPSTRPESYLRKQRLIHRESKSAKVAAAILYAEAPAAVSPKRCSVKIARYNTKVDVPKREHLVGVPLTIEGPARVVIDETLAKVTEMFESVSVIKSDGTMGTVAYPPEALKEIVVNAVIHRDYNVSDDILVSVLNNRVEVRSPGLLPGHMTLDNLLRERFSRNPTIVRLLNKYPDPPNKDIGEGLRTAADKMAEAKLQAPKFRVEGGYFIATLPHVPLARPQEIVLEYLANHEEVTNSIGRSLTGITSENAMKEVFYSLRDAGKIERVPGKAGSRSAWRLVAPLPADSMAEVSPEASEPTAYARARAVEPTVRPGRDGKEVPISEQLELAVERAGASNPPAASRLRAVSRRQATRRAGRSPARNEPCPCGSGSKYKRCHGSPVDRNY
jgi:ATP-dependent DNA helicase RecG